MKPTNRLRVYFSEMIFFAATAAYARELYPENSLEAGYLFNGLSLCFLAINIIQWLAEKIFRTAKLTPNIIRISYFLTEFIICYVSVCALSALGLYAGRTTRILLATSFLVFHEVMDYFHSLFSLLKSRPWEDDE